MTDIRVGLNNLYRGKQSITISNGSIGIGYCIQNAYWCETSFTSENGFQFTPETGIFYKLNKTYTTYEEARRVAQTLKQLGTSAYPVSLYRSEWTVYLGGGSKEEANRQIRQVKERFGFQYSLLENTGHRIKVLGSNDTFLYDGGAKNAYPQFKSFQTNEAGVRLLNLGERSYRGRIEIGSYGNQSLTAVNILNIESYLYGVVPSEMVSSWPLEALKSQAVCARSFALQKAGYGADSDISKAYRMEDTVSSQVYKGYLVEKDTTNQAVNETKGQVISYQGKPISAYYYSTSGGRTENGEDVWGLNSACYRSVPDLYELKPERAPWIVSLTKSQIQSKLSERNLNIGTFQSMIPEIVTESGRIYSLKMKGSSGNAVLQSDTIRTVLGLASTKFKVITYGMEPDKVQITGESVNGEQKIQDCYSISGNGTVAAMSDNLEQYVVMSADNMTNFPKEAPKDENTFYLAGMGYGHGVGLSQSGARGLAEAGFHYKDIIAYYYSGAESHE